MLTVEISGIKGPSLRYAMNMLQTYNKLPGVEVQVALKQGQSALKEEYGGQVPMVEGFAGDPLLITPHYSSGQLDGVKTFRRSAAVADLKGALEARLGLQPLYTALIAVNGVPPDAIPVLAQKLVERGPQYGIVLARDGASSAFKELGAEVGRIFEERGLPRDDIFFSENDWLPRKPKFGVYGVLGADNWQHLDDLLPSVLPPSKHL